MSKAIEWGMEVANISNELSDAGVPGIGLLGKFAQSFYNDYLNKRFESFCNTAEVDEELISQISENEDYANCFYASLETVRQTHSQLGVKALALIYKAHWNDPDFLIPAMRAFNQVSNLTLLAFMELYESIDAGKDYLELKVIQDGEKQFHPRYNEAVELNHRNFFVQSASASMVANGPMQGMKWHHTDAYYDYCVMAKNV
ncbi:MAG: hypothetical protein ACTH6I_11340 [Vibrio litoralis]|uniref:hypothetical protein n=1 Tax=Vibrio litoralis TaxID=335972 RepID=UPI003F9853B7